ncbi:Maph104 [Matsumuraeses phaseoli granulovirus]|uniref:Maph104 n=1 Tax=Matsumuraeses phaseoli granulovirus TaxID=2760664 RepID=A0AAE7MLM7_9BBAC|nr:Maph104 [Matsumuraeses phaseoli granulovirus]QOD40067.1 Maph104 [Matsumuraeses phaseoli granulovirus]
MYFVSDNLNKMNKIIKSKIKHEHVIGIVCRMMQVHSVKPAIKSKMLRKLEHEYYNVNNKLEGESLTLICDTFEVVQREQITKEMLYNSFFKNCKLTNMVLLCSVQKHVVTEKRQKVLLKIYLVGEHQLCEECYTKLGGVNSSPDICSECDVMPENAYFFCSSYICNYCFVNKLYTCL